MIDILEVKDFQTHREKQLILSPRITCITGSSDKGKSSLLRALLWLCLNKPAGADYKRWGSKKAEASIQIGEHVITRSRGSKNLYKMDDEIYEAFGNDVPEDIKRFLKLNKLNFQSQHDSIFWFSESAGEVARELNKIVDLSVMDKAMSFLTKKKRKKSLEIEIKQEEVSNWSVQKEELKYVAQMKADFQKVELWETRWKQTAGKCGECLEYIKAIETHSKVISRACRVLECGEKAVLWGNRTEDLQDKVKKLCSLLQNYKNQKELAESEIPDISELETLSEEYIELKKSKQELNSIIELVKEGESLCREKEELLEQAKTEYQKLHGKNCPLCGNKIK